MLRDKLKHKDVGHSLISTLGISIFSCWWQSHLIYNQIDPVRPLSLSGQWSWLLHSKPPITTFSLFMCKNKDRRIILWINENIFKKPAQSCPIPSAQNMCDSFLCRKVTKHNASPEHRMGILEYLNQGQEYFCSHVGNCVQVVVSFYLIFNSSSKEL